MFFPIKDYNPTKRTAYLTILIIVINVVVFVYQAVFSDLNVNVAKNAMIPWEITHLKTIKTPIGYTVEREEYGFPRRKYIYRKLSPFVSLIFSLFMHGSFLHLFGNMLFLWIFGNNIEDYLGRMKFLIFYFLAGIGASMVHVLFNLNSTVPVIGASGAVSGIMGALPDFIPESLCAHPGFCFFLYHLCRYSRLCFFNCLVSLSIFLCRGRYRHCLAGPCWRLFYRHIINKIHEKKAPNHRNNTIILFILKTLRDSWYNKYLLNSIISLFSCLWVT